MVELSEIRIARLPISFWLLTILLSYAPIIAEMMFPWFSFADKYYTVQFMDNTVIEYFKNLAQQTGLVGIIGNIGMSISVAVTGLMILLEGIIRGFAPTWSMLGLDVHVRGSITIANIFQAIIYASYAWTLYQASHRGVDT